MVAAIDHPHDAGIVSFPDGHTVSIGKVGESPNAISDALTVRIADTRHDRVALGSVVAVEQPAHAEPRPLTQHRVDAQHDVLPHMLRRGGGSLINTTSVNGIVAEPFLAIYATSKGAIVMLTKGIALDYAKQGIRCNAIAPGWVDTPINYAHAELLGGLKEVYATIDSFQPIGRPGEPREIANVALFLASDESSFVTGSVIVADGGMTAK